MKHVMVDLETLGTGNNAVIVSIGAVVFDKNGLYEEFYEEVEPGSCIDIGMQLDIGTIMWWMRQSEKAKRVFSSNAHHIQDVLAEFSRWFPKEAAIWGNGATFDNVILGSAYRLLGVEGVEAPWKYSRSLCYRTLKSLFPNVPVEDYGVAHNALDDAKKQALHAVKLFNLVTKES